MKRKRLLIILLCLPFLCLFYCAGTVLVRWIMTTPTLGLPAPTWKGITPGKTTADEVIQILGQPQQVRDKDFLYPYESGYPIDNQDLTNSTLSSLWLPRPDESVYFYQSPGTVYVILRSGKVWALRVEGSNDVVFSNFVQQHGKPERAGWSKMEICRNAVIYPKLGILMHVDYHHYTYHNAIVEENNVFAVTYFVPMSLEEAAQEFNNEANFRGPETYHEADVYCGTIDPWGFNK